MNAGVLRTPDISMQLRTCRTLTVPVLLAACSHANPPDVPPALPRAFTARLESGINPAIGMGCLERGGDSTLFRVALIVDSVPPTERGALHIVLRPRPAPRPGFVYANVTAEIQLRRATSLQGTACWSDAGIVFRGAAPDLYDATITLDPVEGVEVEVYRGNGRVLVPAMRLDRAAGAGRIEWNASRD